MGWPGSGGVVAWRAHARLDARLLVGADEAVVRREGLRPPTSRRTSPARGRPSRRSAGRGDSSQCWCCQGVSASRSRMRQLVLALIGGASGCAALSRVRSAVLYRLSGWSRCVGSAQASALTVATHRGGNVGLPPAPRPVGQGKAARRPAFPPGVRPVGMLPELPGGGHAVEVRLPHRAATRAWRGRPGRGGRSAAGRAARTSRTCSGVKVGR